MSGGATTTATWSGNPFTGVQQWANAYYASEISASAIPTLSGAAATAAAAVAKVPTFMWLYVSFLPFFLGKKKRLLKDPNHSDTAAKVPTLMAETLGEIRAANAAGASPAYAGLFVVYDLPDRDCAAAASNGEYTIADNGVANYYAYIDSIVTQLKAYSDLRVILVIEPDSLANMVTNLSVQKCANAQAAYYQCIQYALQQLNLPNVAMYIDAGHAGWLGWSANLGPAATLFGQVYNNASKPASLRGLATNVANYNAWSVSPAPSYTSGKSLFFSSSSSPVHQPFFFEGSLPHLFPFPMGRGTF